MKKIFTLLCAAVIAVSTMNAEVLLQESFPTENDPIWSGSNVTSAISGTNWVPVGGSSTTSLKLNTTDDLTYPGYRNTSDGSGCINYGTSLKKIAKPLSENVNSGSVYMAALINVESLGGTGRGYFMGLNTGLTASTAGNNMLKVYAHKTTNGYELSIIKKAESSVYQRQTKELSYGETYLVVAEYKFIEGDNNDSCFLYINPTKGAKPAPTVMNLLDTLQSGSTQKGSNQQADASSLDAAYLNCNTDAKMTMKLDEIKVVTDWSELWEDGEPVFTPTLKTSISKWAANGFVVNEQRDFKFTVTGTNLKGNVTITSNNEDVTFDKSTLTKVEVEAENGAEVTATVKASAVGTQNATITVATEGGKSKTISAEWSVFQSVSTLAELKGLAPYTAAVYAGELNVEYAFAEGWDTYIVANDGTNGVLLSDLSGTASSVKAGDKINKLITVNFDEDGYYNSFVTIGLQQFEFVSQSESAVYNYKEVAVKDLASYAQSYGPGLVKIIGADFSKVTTDTFNLPDYGLKANYTIMQGEDEGHIQLKDYSDLFGTAVPATADITGRIYDIRGFVFVDGQANLTNRTERGKIPTGIENTQSSAANVRKVIRNGEMLILKENKTFNILGTEIK